MTIPAVNALRTLAYRPALHVAVKFIRVLGHIDTVILSRRTSARASDIIDASNLRDLLVSTLPSLVSLHSITFNAVALTSQLCDALFYLPQLEQLDLTDCRAPAAACSIFSTYPSDNKLKHVGLIFGSWTDTLAEVAFMSAFTYGPNLQTLITDQPRILGRLLCYTVTTKLCRLELRQLHDEDARLVKKFLAHERCNALEALVLQDCKFSRGTWDETVTLPRLPELRTYFGSPELASRFILTGSNIQHMKLSVAIPAEEQTGTPKLERLAISSTVQSLDLQLTQESLCSDHIWSTLSDVHSTLQTLRIEHNIPPEAFQVYVLPKCLATLSTLARLSKLFIVAPTLSSPDSRWQDAVVHKLAKYQSTLREISLSIDDVWLCLAKAEWRMFKTNELEGLN
ncbi:hypothetical protein K439DRAFT_1662906 [Ramaria rubella]|nr:hypothetical protein K439DRAFT_1662906 [Ramaria rubella]